MPSDSEKQVHHVIDASTVGLRDHDKFAYWQDVVCRTVVDLECRPSGGPAFAATFKGARLRDLSVGQIEASAHQVSRLAPNISRARDEALIFNFVIAGTALVEQDGRSVVLTPGDGAVCDAQRPYYLRFDDSFKIVTVKLAHVSLAQRATSVHQITARSMSEATQICPIVFSYLSAFSQNVARLDCDTANKIGRNFTELLGAAVDEMILAKPLPLSEYRATALLRVKDYVERNLHEDELDATVVSTALNLSHRYINKLFEAESTSLVRYIWRRRLERAASDLKDPRRHKLGISEVAMSHGFNDLSHFSRVFRQRFKTSPRAYRGESAVSIEGVSTSRNFMPGGI